MKRFLDANPYEIDELREWLSKHNKKILSEMPERAWFQLEFSYENWYWLYEFCPLRWLTERMSDQMNIGEIYLLDKLDKLQEKYEALSENLENAINNPINSDV